MPWYHLNSIWSAVWWLEVDLQSCSTCINTQVNSCQENTQVNTQQQHVQRGAFMLWWKGKTCMWPITTWQTCSDTTSFYHQQNDVCVKHKWHQSRAASIWTRYHQEDGTNTTPTIFYFNFIDSSCSFDFRLIKRSYKVKSVHVRRSDLTQSRLH